MQWSDQPDGGGLWQTLTQEFAGSGALLSFEDDGAQTGGFAVAERFYRIIVP